MITGKQIAPVCKVSGTGKGTCGKGVDRCKRICAAAVPTAQAGFDIKSSLQHYLLQDEVDALLSDAIIPPPPPPKKLPPLRHPMKPDQRHSGLSSELATLVTPPRITNFQALVNDLKNTSYKSYWKKPLGKVPDPVPMFPKGYDIENTTYGRKNPNEGSLYDLIMPKIPLPDATPKSKQPGVQTDRNYCRPAFNPNVTYGYRTNIDKRGKYVKCDLTDPKVLEGTSNYSAIGTIQARRQELYQPSIGNVLAPNMNINSVPEGFSFGTVTETDPEYLPECLSSCEINPKLHLYRKCLSHLNNLRRVTSTRYLPSFFQKLYMLLKYEDKEKTGWIPNDILYNHCIAHLIRFDPSQIEPLLCLWEAFDGSKIKYETFCKILNFKKPLPELPKVPDIDPECLDYRTIYREMVKPGKPRDERPMAAVPSGRYFDLDYPITPEGYCLADRACLPDEVDIKSCLYPSIFTVMHVSHRDMYARREPEVVRRVFEATGEEFTDEKFNKVWEEAKKHHSQGLVCYETFRRSLEDLYPFFKS
ncbi:EF-hand domain-containing family member B [Phthorimaea operculella]|nr:EF-hand domain-containing family member B [Phthorimaea operculella]